MSSRQEFIKKTSLLTLGYTTGLGSTLMSGFNRSGKITILYTNDTHARLDPFPSNAREFAGLGGIAKRASLIKKIRYEEEHVLLLDAGDVFQGTPWFDVYGGAVDMELMSEMNYDAMAIGNHEFDLGLEGFAEAAEKADFPILAANYIARNTPMNPFLQDQIVKEYAGFTVGIFGLGIRLDGTVDPELRDGVRSFDPVKSAERAVNSLRKFHSCDYIICLSHLGFKQDFGGIDDQNLAASVSGIDLIIGGHTHTFLDNPVPVTTPSGKDTLITQMGHSGIRLGRIDIVFDDNEGPFSAESRYYVIGAH